ncbi:hypothetical protein THICB1_100232 [Thiomonas arsenitoxydans]|uniref:Uncharacterized protein n=1 Tax=Thiomonas arsenitoxydans (strain DSM 22701 / CIP 110005 / 3As) TaxID=426114 RepID=A0ABP1YXK8_THIA3|nr:hypothetical protein THICB1_100232 [Thiomonas arsenitoxydans]CQR30790.1 hypothetical protein ACO3_240084 [Thiomonas arsenitoxydans]CQR30807.1 hypothetical protein ACO7_220085 [Thiomonas arsenitoxydans]CQR31799.1 hypothetical protein THICB6_160030 [Thiomonas arsenitoxydans]
MPPRARLAQYLLGPCLPSEPPIGATESSGFFNTMRDRTRNVAAKQGLFVLLREHPGPPAIAGEHQNIAVHTS